jgi:uncharacterized delta-60 repeat protein
LNADLSLDPSFSAVHFTSDNRYCWAALELPDGKILISGDFTTVNGIARRYVARLLPDGRLDEAFDAGNLDNSVWALGRLSDGRVVIAGNFSSINNVQRPRIAILSANGVLDTTFLPGNGFNDRVNSLFVDAGDAIVCGGRFSQFNGTTVGRVARITATGTLDATFNNGGAGADNFVERVLKLPDGRVVVSGNFENFNATALRKMVILQSNGTLDALFNPGTKLNDSVLSVLPVAGGKFLIGGYFTAYGATTRNRIARLNADGTLDAAFVPGTGLNGPAWALFDNGDGRVLAGGDFSSYNDQRRDRLAVIGANGALDAVESHAAFRAPAYEVAFQPDGKLVVGGDFTGAGGRQRNYLARFHSNGTLDDGFSPPSGFNAMVDVVRVQSNGKILVGGRFATNGSFTYDRLIRLLPDGSIDPAWYSGLAFSNGNVLSLHVDGSERIYAGGDFNNWNTVEHPGLVRLLPNGALDESFIGTISRGANDFYGGEVIAIRQQPDGKLVIGGSFTHASGREIGNIARLNEDGTPDWNFDPAGGTNDRVRSIQLLPDGRILIAGDFTTAGGLVRNRLARLLPDGQPDFSFAQSLTGMNGAIYEFRLMTDGRMLICGDFDRVNGQVRNRMAILEEDGSLVPDFNPATGPDDNIFTINSDTSGAVYAGGWIRDMQGTHRSGLVRMVATPGFAVNLTSISPSGAVPLNQPLTLTASAAVAGASITGVVFEASTDGVQFAVVADGTLQAGGAYSGTWTPPSSGTWFIRGLAADTQARTQASIALPVTVQPAGYAAWVAQNFSPAEQANASISGPTADPDRDSVANLIEYATGTQPKNAASSKAPTVETTALPGGNFLTLVWTKSSQATDITWAAEVSTNLAAWNSGPAFTTLVSETPVAGGSLIRVRENNPITTGQRRSMRLRVSVP